MDWGQEEKGTTEDEMVGRHHRLNGYEFEQTLGVGDGQGSLVCCSPWGLKEWEMTKQLTELIIHSTRQHVQRLPVPDAAVSAAPDIRASTWLPVILSVFYSLLHNGCYSSNHNILSPPCPIVMFPARPEKIFVIDICV